jgi:hypothetical protein
MTSDSALADKRDRALDHIFGQQTGRTRNAEAATISAVEALDRLVAALDAGDQLGDDYGEARAQIDMKLYESALALGHASLDGMQGMIHSNAVDQAIPMPRRHDQAFNPLDDAWQQSGSPYREARSLAEGLRSQLVRLTKQPNQLFRRLAESVALAADLAAWTSWVIEAPDRR